MEEVDVIWCKVWVVTITFKERIHAISSRTTGTIDFGVSTPAIGMSSVKTLQVAEPYVPKMKQAERFYYLQKGLADKKVQTLQAQEYPGYEAEVSSFEGIGWTATNGSTINVSHMNTHIVSTD